MLGVFTSQYQVQRKYVHISKIGDNYISLKCEWNTNPDVFTPCLFTSVSCSREVYFWHHQRMYGCQIRPLNELTSCLYRVSKMSKFQNTKVSPWKKSGLESLFGNGRVFACIEIIVTMQILVAELSDYREYSVKDRNIPGHLFLMIFVLSEFGRKNIYKPSLLSRLLFFF